MKTKEKSIPDEITHADTHDMKQAVILFGASFVTGFLLTGVRIGSVMSPFGAAACAALPFPLSAAALSGMLTASALGGDVFSAMTDLLSAAAMVIFGRIFRDRISDGVRSAVCGAVYIICGLAAAFGVLDFTLGAAIVLRGLMCGAITFFACRLIRSGGDITDSVYLVPASAVYIIMICAMCPKTAAVFTLGRTAAAFAVCAAARKYGVKGGAAAGILSGAAFLLSDPVMGRCGMMLAFGGLVSGLFARHGKHHVNVAFVLSCFGITAAAGLPSGTPEFIADICLGGAVYCLVPESLYTGLMKLPEARSGQDILLCARRMSFSAEIIEDVVNDVGSAAFILANKKRSSRDCSVDTFACTLRAKVCSVSCGRTGCHAVGGNGGGTVLDSDIAAAKASAEKKGMLTQAALPAGFEGCTRKQEIVSQINGAVGIRRMQQRSEAFVRRFLDGISEQLSAAGGMMTSFSRELEQGGRISTGLSDTAAEIMKKGGLDAECGAVIMKNGQVFIECYCEGGDADGGTFYDEVLSPLTDRLSALVGRDLDMPSVTRLTGKEHIFTRIRWCERTLFAAECSALCYASEGVSGDSQTSFEDGLGNFYVIVSDGMGRGGRAAAQSGMAVNILRRLITAGICLDSAVKTVNTLLSAADSEEVFATLDILRIDCYSGESELIKLGSASTFVRTADGDGALFTCVYDAFSAPVGIIALSSLQAYRFTLDERSRVVLVTDGVTEECARYIGELMENEKLTTEQTAERIMAFTDEYEESDSERMRLRDDKTAAAVRLYRKYS